MTVGRGWAMLACAAIFAAHASAGTVLARKTHALPVIDGKMEPGEWDGATTFTEFNTVVPKTADKFYDSTVVRMLQSSDALYFAFQFYPRCKVIRQSLIRDVSSDEENEFFIVLDLENRNENGYIFIFNFNNNQRDMAVYNQRSLVPEWDWVWQSRTTVYREAEPGKPGYIETEVRIPVDKFQNKNRHQIGVDLQMFAYKADGSSYFYAMTPESEVLTLKSTYKLDIEPFDESFTPDVTALPFAVGQKVGNTATTGSVGGDINLSLDKHKLKATIQTDESTLEADPFQFSLYGQSIFLQEKRPFLSKDLDIYKTPINLFYTRAIQQISWGANYTYRSDALKAGFVAVEDEFDAGGAMEKRQLAVARPNWQTTDMSVGATLLYERNLTTHSSERMGSVDARIDLPLGLRLFPQLAVNNSGNAYQMLVSLPRNWAGGTYGSASYRRFGQDFNVSTLFNDYGSGYDEVDLQGGYRTVSTRSLFSQIELYGEYFRARTLQTDFTYQQFVSVGAYNQALENLYMSHRFEYNEPDQDTPDGRVKRKNFLQDHNIRVIVGPHSFTFGYNFGPYFGSYLKSPYVTAKVIFWDRMAWDVSFIDRSYDDVHETIMRVKLDFRVMDHLYFRSFVQRDSYYQLGLWNTLLQYEFFAGSNVYLVLNQEGERFENSGKFFKVGYEVSF